MSGYGLLCFELPYHITFLLRCLCCTASGGMSPENSQEAAVEAAEAATVSELAASQAQLALQPPVGTTSPLWTPRSRHLKRHPPLQVGPPRQMRRAARAFPRHRLAVQVP